METYDYGDFRDEELSTQDAQYVLYDLIGFDRLDNPGDDYVHDTFWSVMYDDTLPINQRIDMYNELIDYVYDEYGIDFGETWDWQDFREWYDSA